MAKIRLMWLLTAWLLRTRAARSRGWSVDDGHVQAEQDRVGMMLGHQIECLPSADAEADTGVMPTVVRVDQGG
jgi:hypothetical protein